MGDQNDKEDSDARTGFDAINREQDQNDKEDSDARAGFDAINGGQEQNDKEDSDARAGFDAINGGQDQNDKEDSDAHAGFDAINEGQDQWQAPDVSQHTTESRESGTLSSADDKSGNGPAAEDENDDAEQEMTSPLHPAEIRDLPTPLDGVLVGSPPSNPDDWESRVSQ